MRYWEGDQTPRQLRPDEHPGPCPIDLTRFDPTAYAYVLAMYLGDGCISPVKRSFRLRITLDTAYPCIVAECAKAVATLLPERNVRIQSRHPSRCIDVGAQWKHWPCVFPQHGPGRKHLRPIELTAQQRAIVFHHPEDFLRGLIHSDGTRIIAVERKGNSERRVPRYAFSNLSEDILNLFREACDAVGVHTTRPSVKQVAVYRKASVAILDEFIGPKN